MRAVNLIPAEQRGGASVGAGRSQGAAYAVLGLLAGLAVMAVMYGIAHHQVTSATSEAASISTQAQQAQAQAERLAPYASFVTAQEQRTQQVAQIVDSRFDWAHVFHEFGRVIPATASVTSLTGTIVPASTSTASAPDLEQRLDQLGLRGRDSLDGRLGGVGDPAREHPHLLDRRLRQDPGGRGTAARAPAPDRRCQQRDAAELDQDRGRRRRDRQLPGERTGLQRDRDL